MFSCDGVADFLKLEHECQKELANPPRPSHHERQLYKLSCVCLRLPSSLTLPRTPGPCGTFGADNSIELLKLMNNNNLFSNTNIRQPRKDDMSITCDSTETRQAHDMQPDPFVQPLPRHFALPTRLTARRDRRDARPSPSQTKCLALGTTPRRKEEPSERLVSTSPPGGGWRKSLERDALGFTSHLRTVEHTNSATSGLKICRTALQSC